MNQNRRDFLKQASGAALGLMLSSFLPGFSRIAQAALQAEDHFFVFINTNGGMDSSVGLDPQILAPDADSEDIFLPYRADDVVQAGALRLGPAAVALKDFAESCAAVNGIMMRRDAGHDTCNLYMASGSGAGKSAIAAVELCVTYGAGPYGVLVDNSSLYTAERKVIVSSYDNLVNIASNAESDPTLGLEVTLAGNTASSELVRAQRAVLDSLIETKKLASYLDHLKSQGVSQFEPKHVLAGSFLSGSAKQGVVNISAQLDTHSDFERQHVNEQRKVWEAVADLFKFFKQIPYGTGSLFDHTTFMVSGEFSRTPALNGSKGKDHNANTNSILLAGRGVNGGRAYGASRVISRKKLREKLRKNLLAQYGELSKEQEDAVLSERSLYIARPFDYSVGQAVERLKSASFIFPENVIQTVGKIFGSPVGFAGLEDGLPSIPGLAKS